MLFPTLLLFLAHFRVFRGKLFLRPMKIKELGFHKTPLGDLTLRVRPEPLLGIEKVYEVKLGDEFLMSSLFTEGEKQLARIGLNGLDGKLDVVVGGLGLGYTVAAALDFENVSSLLVIDAFREVINWHQEGLVPMGERLTNDERCKMLKGDFFSMARQGFDAEDPARKFDAVLLDIDHSPHHYLDENNESFYSEEGLQKLSDQLRNGGVFALWSDDPPEEAFRAHLESVFGSALAEEIEFQNSYTASTSLNSIYKAIKS